MRVSRVIATGGMLVVLSTYMATGVSQPGQEALAAPPLSVVLSRAANYVEAFAGRLSGLVMEEAYVQDVEQLNRFGYRMNTRGGVSHRRLRSDLLLVRPEGSDAWMQFRDVFEVDGKPVRDRNDRLERLFLQPSKSTASQAEKIVRESARYNIGDIERTINLPLLALTVLDRRMQSNFQFRMGDVDEDVKLPRSAAFTERPGAVEVAFTEATIRTMITTPQGKNLRSHGRFWFAMPEAEVLMTELGVDDYTLSATIHVAYERKPGLAAPVPVEMHELYLNRLNNQTKVEGTATYSNFREFNVKVDEQIAPLR
jgi:hypothetical protein